jgi:hypothetical protein
MAAFSLNVTLQMFVIFRYRFDGYNVLSGRSLRELSSPLVPGQSLPKLVIEVDRRPRYDAAGAKSPEWSSKYRSSVEFALVSVDRLRDERIVALTMLCLRVCSSARLTQCKGEAYCRC